jgi:hypothetical protein
MKTHCSHTCNSCVMLGCKDTQARSSMISQDMAQWWSWMCVRAMNSAVSRSFFVCTFRLSCDLYQVPQVQKCLCLSLQLKLWNSRLSTGLESCCERHRWTRLTLNSAVHAHNRSLRFEPHGHVPVRRIVVLMLYVIFVCSVGTRGHQGGFW